MDNRAFISGSDEKSKRSKQHHLLYQGCYPPHHYDPVRQRLNEHHKEREDLSNGLPSSPDLTTSNSPFIRALKCIKFYQFQLNNLRIASVDMPDISN